MNQNANEAAPPFVAGPFADPFKDWPNSDLLIDEEDRAFFARHYPAFAPIFDWPELRSLFATYDAAAGSARKHSRRSGVFAVAAGLLSLTVAASVPLMDEITKGLPAQHSTTQAVLGGVARFLSPVEAQADTSHDRLTR